MSEDNNTGTGPDLAGTRTVALIRLAPLRPAAAVWLGEAPVLLAALAISGLLWGTGHDLASAGLQPGSQADGRAAAAWLSVVALVLLFTYPLLGMVVRLMRGFWYRPPLVHRLAEAVTKRRRMRQERAKEAAMQSARALLRAEAALRAPRDPSDAAGLVAHAERTIAAGLTPVVRPTRLGDEEAAVARRVERRYGLALGYAWPRLAGLIQEPLRGTLADAERGADTAVYLAAGWLTAAAWLLAATIWLSAAQAGGGVGPWWFTLAGTAGALALYVDGYRRAVDRAAVLGRLVESAVDLHRFALLDALGWRRPKNEEEERRIFAALSAALAYGAPTDSPYQRYATPGESGIPFAEARHALDAAVAQVPQMVSAGILGQVERELRGVLHSVLAGQPLSNFDGHLSVTLMDGGSLVGANGNGVFSVTSEQEYQLVIAIGQQPADGAETAPVRIRGGKDDAVVPFAVSVDSNITALRKDEQPLAVDRYGDAELKLPIRLRGASAESAWLWIRVAQHDRTIQNLEITLDAAGR